MRLLLDGLLAALLGCGLAAQSTGSAGGKPKGSGEPPKAEKGEPGKGAKTPPGKAEPGKGAKTPPEKGEPGKGAKTPPEKAEPRKEEAGKAGDGAKVAGEAAEQKAGERIGEGEKPGAGKDPYTEKSAEEIAEEQALPAGADPSDIAAMRSAQAMLEAEARLRRMLKDGSIKGIDRILTFEEISSWPYEDGLRGLPAPVKKMDGKTVMMTGFMLPIDEVEEIKEFLLVQSLWSCCYGQPPDINGIVRVVMKGDKRIDYKYDPIRVTGQFKVVASYEDGYCIDIFQLHADSVKTID